MPNCDNILLRIFFAHRVLFDTILFAKPDTKLSWASWRIMNIKSIFEVSKRPISASADAMERNAPDVRRRHQGQTVDGKIIGFAEMVGKKNGEQGRRKIGVGGGEEDWW